MAVGGGGPHVEVALAHFFGHLHEGLDPLPEALRDVQGGQQGQQGRAKHVQGPMHPHQAQVGLDAVAPERHPCPGHRFVTGAHGHGQVHTLVAVTQGEGGRRRSQQGLADGVTEKQADLAGVSVRHHATGWRDDHDVPHTGIALESVDHLLQSGHVVGQHPGARTHRQRLGQPCRSMAVLSGEVVALLTDVVNDKDRAQQAKAQHEHADDLALERGASQGAHGWAHGARSADRGRTVRSKVAMKSRTTS